jgi:hypothetical protein
MKNKYFLKKDADALKRDNRERRKCMGDCTEKAKEIAEDLAEMKGEYAHKVKKLTQMKMGDPK